MPGKPMVNQPVFEALVAAARTAEPVSLGLISGVKGSSPQKIGAKALFFRDGRIVGTLGGGCLEAEIQRRAVQCLVHGKPEQFDLLLDHDFGWDDGLICGGKVEGVIIPNPQNLGEAFWGTLAERRLALEWGVRANFSIGLCHAEGEAKPGDWLYTESVEPPCSLWIAGAGHIAQAVAPLALKLDFAVTIFDDRPALASHSFFPPQAILKADAWEKLLNCPFPQRPAFGLIVTRGHRHDALVLREWIHKPFAFLGMIGSARKARTLFDYFQAENLATPAELARVACPVGVEIGSRSVMEIAVSIMAQFIQKRAELVPQHPGKTQAH
jgi:xanthine dehydrogenase accessory factor